MANACGFMTALKVLVTQVGVDGSNHRVNLNVGADF